MCDSVGEVRVCEQEREDEEEDAIRDDKIRKQREPPDCENLISIYKYDNS